MTKTNRKTLISYFDKGKKPDSSHFADLIESMLNIVDDGLDKSPERGLLLSPLDNDGAVIEIRRNILEVTPSWIIALGDNGELQIKGQDEQEVLTFKTDGQLIIGQNHNVRLKVNGSVEADSFIGGYLKNTIPADGCWHDIGEKDYSCRGYHIVAACGLKGKGRYALAEVTAMYCFGKHRRIWNHRSWFGTRFNKIQFRWHREGINCGLQVRTRCNYGEDVLIHFQMNNLFDIDFVTRH